MKPVQLLLIFFNQGLSPNNLPCDYSRYRFISYIIILQRATEKTMTILKVFLIGSRRPGKLPVNKFIDIGKGSADQPSLDTDIIPQVLQ